MIHVSHVTFKSKCLVEDTTATIKTTALPLLLTRNEMFKKKKQVHMLTRMVRQTNRIQWKLMNQFLFEYR